MMKKPDEFQEETELTTETKAKITATLERLKEDGLDLYGCDYVDVKDLAYIYHAAHYLMRYVEGMQATIEGMDIAQVDFCRRIKQLEAERDAAVDHVRGDCAYCTYLPGETIPYSCFDCANKGYYRWEFRGAQKEG